MVFFFQLASLIKVKVLRRSYTSAVDDGENQFTESLFDAFNFKFSVYREICPTNDLTLISKLFINLGLKISTLLNVCFILVLHTTFQWILRREDKEVNQSEELCELNIGPISSSAG